MLYNDHPTKRSDREKGQPEQPTEITHGTKLIAQDLDGKILNSLPYHPHTQNPKLKTRNSKPVSQSWPRRGQDTTLWM
jgi:hypothetical protein